MAYFIPQPAPQPFFIEEAQPPVFIQPAPQPVVAVVQNPAPVVVNRPIKDLPTSVKCNLCQQQVVTMTKPINGLITWTIFGVLFFFLIWPFCLIPFCVKTCRDIKHTCPNCQNVIHIYKRM